jgi:hypothetical protein
MPQTRAERVVAAVMLISSVVLIVLIAREAARTDEPRAAARVAEVVDAVSPPTTSARPAEPATTQATTTIPAATVAAAPKPPAPRLARLVLVASGGDSWLEVRAASAQGKVFYEGILARGNDVRAAAKQLWVRFGGASNVTAQLNGKPLPLRAGTYSALITPDGVEVVGG